jgi:hypothetical protein
MRGKERAQGALVAGGDAPDQLGVLGGPAHHSRSDQCPVSALSL